MTINPLGNFSLGKMRYDIEFKYIIFLENLSHYSLIKFFTIFLWSIFAQMNASHSFKLAITLDSRAFSK
jgi:hypothetical protein